MEIDKTVRRVRKGDTAVAFWGGFLLLGTTLHALKIIPTLPHELFRTSIQVIALYSLALISKSKRAAAEREKQKAPKPTATVSLAAAVALSSPTPPPDQLPEKIVNLLNGKNLSNAEIMVATGLSRSRTSDYLRRLVEEGRIVKSGNGSRTVYGTEKGNCD